MGLKAKVATPCGNWPEDLASGSSLEGWKNEPYANFGCASQAVLAAQVDDPRDFVQPRALGPSDVAMRMRAIEDVRNGKDPGTDWATDLDADRRERDASSAMSLARRAAPAVVQIDPLPRVSIQAFCESVEASAVVADAAADRRMAKAQVKQNMGGAAAALEAYRNAATPNVIVLEAPADRSALIAELDELAQNCDPGTKVVVLGRANDVALYRQLIARGVSEYLAAAVRGRGLRAGDLPAVPRAGREAARPRRRRGRRQGRRRRLDCGAQPRLVARLRSRTRRRSSPTSTSPSAPPGSTTTRTRPRASPTRCSRPSASTRCSSTGCSPNAATTSACSPRPATLDRVLDFSDTAFDTLLDAMRASTPWIVLDLPHVWTGWARRTLIAADDVILVASPDLANLRNAKNLIDALKAARPNDHPPRLVINGVGMMRRPEIALADFARTVEVKPIAVIPARRQALRRRRQQWPDDRGNRSEGKDRPDVRRTRPIGRRLGGAGAIAQESARTADVGAAPGSGLILRRAA